MPDLKDLAQNSIKELRTQIFELGAGNILWIHSKETALKHCLKKHMVFKLKRNCYEFLLTGVTKLCKKLNKGIKGKLLILWMM